MFCFVIFLAYLGCLIGYFLGKCTQDLFAFGFVAHHVAEFVSCSLIVFCFINYNIFVVVMGDFVVVVWLCLEYILVVFLFVVSSLTTRLTNYFCK